MTPIADPRAALAGGNKKKPRVGEGVGMKPLAEIKLEPIGLGLHDHNMPCAICQKAPAVFTNHGFYFDPCWSCQEKGWLFMPPPRGWIDKLLNMLRHP